MKSSAKIERVPLLNFNLVVVEIWSGWPSDGYPKYNSTRKYLNIQKRFDCIIKTCAFLLSFRTNHLLSTVLDPNDAIKM
jgi:hypothetical protein